jgi:NAD(P)-dependent dehydrogenase (short-subunit alcohol dehydrogenase family)
MLEMKPANSIKNMTEQSLSIGKTPALANKIAVVAGATRGAGRGIAMELGAAGAVVYCTGRSTRSQRSDMNRSETIDELPSW